MVDEGAKAFLRDKLLKPPSPQRAVTSSIQFLKERIGPDRQLHALRWVDEAGGHWSYIYAVARDAGGAWRICGGGGGGGGDSWAHPKRGYPWVNLAGNYGAEGLFAGGEVCDDADGTVARVRLLDTAGVLAEDTVENGAVLFMAYRPVDVDQLFAIVAELYDAAGGLVGAHSAFGRHRQGDPPVPGAPAPEA